jgi:C-terminal processing protease CtpA/Prc
MPEVEWIHDTSLLGAHLRRRLELIYTSRGQLPEQYYASLAQVGNPAFENESAYPNLTDPDAGFRLLALFRHWNIIEYWFPYRDVLGEDWDGVLAEFVPILMEVEGADAYALAMMRLIARVNDTHANLWSRLALRPPTGPAQVPVSVRFIEEQAVVTGCLHEELGPASGLRVGDVILSLDEVPVDSLVEAWRPYYAASNQPTRLRDMARTLTRGDPGPVRVQGMREGGPFELTVERVPIPDLNLTGERTHDLPGPTFQMLSPEVAYLKLSSVESAKVGDYIREASSAEVLVIDIRNYPSEFVVFSLGNLLVSEPTPFARFTRGDMSNPGAFLWGPEVGLTPTGPGFEGKVVILVDEVSQSQAEYTTMAFRSSPRALVVGSTTAGADGNVSPIPLPGGVSTLISGIGVFYPDRSPTQRVGIIPDLEVRPTIQGIREGRDEVLEAGVSQALGRPFHMPRETGAGIR